VGEFDYIIAVQGRRVACWRTG